MNKYYDIASKYFNMFEGKHLYPNLKSWIWVAWAVYALDFVAAFGVFVYVVDTTTTHAWSIFFGALILAAEIGFLAINSAIDDYKKHNQNKHFGLIGPNFKDDLKSAKRKALEQLVGQRAESFLAVAKEIAELQATKNTFAQPELGFWRSIFHPDSKSRLISILLGAVALIAALIANAVDGTAFFDLIASNHLPTILGLSVYISIIFHFFIYGCRLAYRVLSGKVMEWLLRFRLSKAADKLALSYMVNELVELHEPVSTALQPAKA